MEKLILFFKIITWIGAIIGTIFSIMCIAGTLTYPRSRGELFDKINGVKRTYSMLLGSLLQ